jgi:hypothetical protein
VCVRPIVCLVTERGVLSAIYFLDPLSQQQIKALLKIQANKKPNAALP